LPEQVQVCSLRESKHVLIARGTLGELVTVQKNRPNLVADITIAFVASDFLTRQFNERERVAAAGPKQNNVEM
jgi:hypothetical protein